VGKAEAAEALWIEGHEVRITHPDKLYFSRQTKVSKLDLVRYYLSVAPGAVQPGFHGGRVALSKSQQRIRGALEA
jgi:DNA primase